MTYMSYETWDEDDFTQNPTTGCWIWKGPWATWGNASGIHGVIRKSLHRNAVRQIAEDLLGEPIPTDIWLVSDCPTNQSFWKTCVNPSHYRWVSVNEVQ